MDLYELVRGPLAWVALVVFISGSLYRIVSFLFTPGSLGSPGQPSSSRNILRSIFFWMVPFGSGTMRRNPVLTLISFFFHVCVIVTPVFLLAHNVLWYESWGFQLCCLSEGLADFLTVFIIATCAFFLIRRMMVPEVREVTKPSDFVLLVLVVLPFVFGFFAYHGWGPYRPMLILHILSGEILLVAIPFTRLGHMLLFAFGRAQIATEIAPVTASRDW